MLLSFLSAFPLSIDPLPDSISSLPSFSFPALSWFLHYSFTSYHCSASLTSFFLYLFLSPHSLSSSLSSHFLNLFPLLCFSNPSFHSLPFTSFTSLTCVFFPFSLSSSLIPLPWSLFLFVFLLFYWHILLSRLIPFPSYSATSTPYTPPSLFLPFIFFTNIHHFILSLSYLLTTLSSLSFNFSFSSSTVLYFSLPGLHFPSLLY